MLEEAFRLFDKDGDGNITSSELQSVMNSLGQPVDIRQASEMIMSVDKDGKHHNIVICDRVTAWGITNNALAQSV